MPKGVYKRTERSKNFLGKKHSLITKKLLSEIKLSNPPKFWLGKKRTPEDRKKKSLAKLDISMGGIRLRRIVEYK